MAKTIKRKYNKGDEVLYRKKKWVVCDGGAPHSDPSRKSYCYKLSRGAWKLHVPGDCISGFFKS